MGIYAELFEQILETPEMYVGDKSLIKISFFLHGFFYGFERNKGKLTEDSLFDGFQKYVQNCYEMGSTHNWADILLFMERSDYRAFERAKVLWKEYKAEVDQERDTES